MKYSEDRNEEAPMETYYREAWTKASGREMFAEAEGRILRAVGKRIKADAYRIVPGRWMRYAAAVFAGTALGLAVSSFFDRMPPEADTVPGEFVLFADKGQRSNITLPDGTKVWLNSHSKIVYSTDYGHRTRSLSLTGEACFEVAKDAGKPFLVRAGEMQIEALGTSFNVKAYGEDREIVATLFEGSVQATVHNKTIVLAPEEYASYDTESRRLTVRRAENVAYASMWRDNELSFNRQTMDEIAIMLNRLYNVNIRFESEKIKTCRFSGVIKNNSLDNVIEIISLTAPISYRTKGDTIILSERKNPVKLLK